MFLIFEFIGTEKFEATFWLVALETVGVALKELEDVVDNDGFEINLFLVVKVFSFQLNL